MWPVCRPLVIDCPVILSSLARYLEICQQNKTGFPGRKFAIYNIGNMILLPRAEAALMTETE